jgi:hypothetical protein
MSAEVPPDRGIVIGAYTQPWHGHVGFHSLASEEFAALDEPDTRRLDARGPTGRHERFGPRHAHPGRHDDTESRRRCRLYWAPMAAGMNPHSSTCLRNVRPEVATALAGGLGSPRAGSTGRTSSWSAATSEGSAQTVPHMSEPCAAPPLRGGEQEISLPRDAAAGCTSLVTG